MSNKYLLLKDVENLGRSGDIVSARPGYARNKLLPEGFAIVASPAAMRMQARLQEERRQRALVDKQESEELAGRLNGITLVKSVKVDPEGHMYGSVSANDVVELLQQQGYTLERRSLLMKQAIKETGNNTINLKLKEGVTASIKLRIIPEGQTEQEAEESGEEQSEEQQVQ